MRRVASWLTCLALAALAVPAAASADGALTRVAGQLHYDSDSQDAENLVITRQTTALECGGAGTPCLQFANGPQGIRDQVPGSDCVQVIATVVSCTPTGVTSIFLKLDDGDDFVRMGNNVPVTTMDGSFGADNLTSDNGADIVLGGPGDDDIFDDDSGGGADVLDGGAGNDTIVLGSGDDDVVGGAGTDTVEMDSGDDTVRLDGLANDGPAGEAKNVRADVEVVDGGFGSDNLFGNAAANTLLGGPGNDILSGGGGPDVLEGGAGADELSGGPDVDRVVYSDPAAQTITLDDVRNDGAAGELDNVRSDVEDVSAGAGNDVVVGSAAANVLDGGAGDDRLDGRGGVDTFVGGDGADTLLARDGLRERVDCGAQADGGQADTIDLLVACENVALSSALVPDADGDGVAKPRDCDDDNPAINPGAVDIPGNEIDEDCREGPAPFPQLDSTIGVTFEFGSRFTRFTTLVIRRVRAGSRLRLRCRGRGCPFKTRKRRLARDRRTLTIPRPLRRARLRPGARFEVRVTRRATIGIVSSFKVRADKAPARRDRCLPPGSKRPVRCPD